MRACAYDGVVYTQEYIDKEIATCLKSESSKELNKRAGANLFAVWARQGEDPTGPNPERNKKKDGLAV